MLSQWTVGNFKAIDESITLDLSPVTVLAGANSSGKSSLLQSILLVAQTLRAKPGEQPILLNGEYVRLGYISDVLHNGKTSEPCVVGFQMTQAMSELLLKASGGIELFPILVRAAIRSDTRSSQQPRTKIKRLDMSWGESDRLVLTELVDGRLDLANPRFADMDIAPEQRIELQQGQYQYELARSTRPFSRIEPYSLQASLQHFFPFHILETYDGVTEDARNALLAIAVALRSQDSSATFPAIEKVMPDTLLDRTLQEYIQKEIAKIRASDQTVRLQAKNRVTNLLHHSRSLIEWVNQVQHEIPQLYRTEISQQLRRFALSLRARQKNLGTNEIGVRAVDLPTDLRLGIDLVTDYFANNVYYVGPLRESPQFIYSLPPYPEVTHVGLKGEFSASVLEHFKSQPIEYPLPPKPDGQGDRSAHGPLAIALRVWLEHMGLLEDVATTDRGKMGTELTVRSHGVKRDLDLTSIGVGVSQVLPTLVTGLIAAPGTTFLLEQPELHLHPRVQSSLADFFLGLANVGKQCIVETHSEYLINRLRRRVAEDDGDRLAKQIQIYFVEREDGKARFQKVDLNEYGAIVKWPKGFFDEGPSEAQLIMNAAMQKKRRLQSKEG